MLSHVWEGGAFVFRVLQTLGTLHYQLISTLIEYVTNGYSALCVILTYLSATLHDLALYIFGFFKVFGYVLHICTEVAFKLVVLFTNFITEVSAILAELALVTLQMLLSNANWVWIQFGIGAKHVKLLAESSYEIARSQWQCIWNKNVIVLLRRVNDNLSAYHHAIQTKPGYSTVLSVIVFIIILAQIIKQLTIMMRQKGLTVPSFIHSRMSYSVAFDGSDQRDTGLIFVSDEETDNDSSDSDDRNSAITRSSHISSSIHSARNAGDSDISSNSDSEISTVSLEYEIVEDDSDIESGDENDQNAINIQLPSRNQGYVLRSRMTPTPARLLDKFNQDDMVRYMETERDRRACVVCQDQIKNVLVLPCKHMCMCVDCAHMIAGSLNPTRRVCPLCRTPIDTVMDVYL